MKSRFSLSVLFVTALLWNGCQNDEVNPGNTFEVKPYSKISIDGKVKVILKDDEPSSDSDYSITILSNENQLKRITVTSEDGTLYITADENIHMNDEVIIEIHNSDIFEIKLEAEQVAVFEGDLHVKELHVKTEARSELTLSGIFVEKLISKQEGESILNIANEAEEVEGPVAYAQDDATKLNDTTLLVENRFYVYGDSVKLEVVDEDTVWVVHGDFVEIEYEIPYCEFKTEGNTTINAEYAMIRELYIKLEGSSEANVWVTEKLDGKGEGSSILYYKGTPTIDFITEGGAKIYPH